MRLRAVMILQLRESPLIAYISFVLPQQAGQQVLEEETAQLWWASKELMRSKKLRDYVGRNEKTKIVAKLQRKGQGAPAREPVFSEEEQKKMMAYAYRKQEELKVLLSLKLCGVRKWAWFGVQS